MEKRLVSVITPCYNSEKYIGNLIKSIVNQTYPNLEFIMIDDGSKDNTEGVIKTYIEDFDKRNIEFKYIKQKNKGQAAAINNALQYVHGEYLLWPGSDDYYENDAIENMVNFLDKNKDYHAVRGKVAFRKDTPSKEIVEIRESNNPNKTDLFLNYIIEEDTYCFTGIMMIRMENFMKNNKGKRIYENRAGQNWQIILPSVYNSKTGYIDKVVYNVIARENSHSRKKEEHMRDVLKRMHNHRKILNKTVSKIIDDKKEKQKYLKIIKEKYDTRRNAYLKYKLNIKN